MIALKTEAQRTRFMAFLMQQALPLSVEVKRYRPTRSNEMNAYLWRAVYQPLVEVAGFTKDDWHEFYCGEVWGWADVEKPGGRSERRPARTTTTGFDGKRDVLDAKEFRRFVDFIEADLASKGVFLTERLEDA